MATETYIQEFISIPKGEEEEKKLTGVQLDATADENYPGELKKVEGAPNDPPEIFKYSERTENMQAACSIGIETVSTVNKGNDGTSEGESFLESPSVSKVAYEDTGRVSEDYQAGEIPNQAEKEIFREEMELQKYQILEGEEETEKVDIEGVEEVKGREEEVVKELRETTSQTNLAPIQRELGEPGFGGGQDKESDKSSISMPKENDLEAEEKEHVGDEGKDIPNDGNRDMIMTTDTASTDETALQEAGITFKEKSLDATVLHEVKDAILVEGEIQDENKLDSPFVAETEDLGSQNVDKPETLKEVSKTGTDIKEIPDEKNLPQVNPSEQIETEEAEILNKNSNESYPFVEEAVRVEDDKRDNSSKFEENKKFEEATECKSIESLILQPTSIDSGKASNIYAEVGGEIVKESSDQDLEGSIKECAEVEKVAAELEAEAQSIDSEPPDTKMNSGPTEENKPLGDPGEKLEDAPESVAKCQSNENLFEMSQSQTEENTNNVQDEKSESVVEQNIEQGLQEGENNKYEDTASGIDASCRIHEIQNANETTSERTVDISHSISEVSQEISKALLQEAETCYNKLHTESEKVETEETSTCEAQLDEELLKGTENSSEDKPVIPAETSSQGEEGEGIELEGTTKFMSQLPPIPHENEEMESATVEKSQADEVGETKGDSEALSESKEQFAEEIDGTQKGPTVEESEDIIKEEIEGPSETESRGNYQVIEAVIQDEFSVVQNATMEKSEEQYQETSRELLSKEQDDRILATVGHSEDGKTEEDETTQNENIEDSFATGTSEEICSLKEKPRELEISGSGIKLNENIQNVDPDEPLKEECFALDEVSQLEHQEDVSAIKCSGSPTESDEVMPLSEKALEESEEAAEEGENMTDHITEKDQDVKECPAECLGDESVHKVQHSEAISDENPRATNSEEQIEQVNLEAMEDFSKDHEGSSITQTMKEEMLQKQGTEENVDVFSSLSDVSEETNKVIEDAKVGSNGTDTTSEKVETEDTMLQEAQLDDKHIVIIETLQTSTRPDTSTLSEDLDSVKLEETLDRVSKCPVIACKNIDKESGIEDSPHIDEVDEIRGASESVSESREQCVEGKDETQKNLIVEESEGKFKEEIKGSSETGSTGNYQGVTEVTEDAVDFVCTTAEEQHQEISNRELSEEQVCGITTTSDQIEDGKAKEGETPENENLEDSFVTGTTEEIHMQKEEPRELENFELGLELNEDMQNVNPNEPPNEECIALDEVSQLEPQETVSAIKCPGSSTESDEIMPLSEEALEGAEKAAEEGEDMKDHIIEKDQDIKECPAVCLGDEPVHKLQHSEAIYDENPRAANSEEQIDQVNLEAMEDFSKDHEGSPITKTMKEEMLQKQGTEENVDVSSSLSDISEEINKVIEDAEVGSNGTDTTFEKVETEDTRLQDDKHIVIIETLQTCTRPDTSTLSEDLDSVKLEETLDRVSQCPVIACKNTDKESGIEDSPHIEEVDEIRGASESVFESREQCVEGNDETQKNLIVEESEEGMIKEEIKGSSETGSTGNYQSVIEVTKDEVDVVCTTAEEQYQETSNTELSEEQVPGITTTSGQLEDGKAEEGETPESENPEDSFATGTTEEIHMQKEEPRELENFGLGLELNEDMQDVNPNEPPNEECIGLDEVSQPESQENVSTIKCSDPPKESYEVMELSAEVTEESENMEELIEKERDVKECPAVPHEDELVKKEAQFSDENPRATCSEVQIEKEGQEFVEDFNKDAEGSPTTKEMEEEMLQKLDTSGCVSEISVPVSKEVIEDLCICSNKSDTTSQKVEKDEARLLEAQMDDKHATAIETSLEGKVPQTDITIETSPQGEEVDNIKLKETPEVVLELPAIASKNTDESETVEKPHADEVEEIKGVSEIMSESIEQSAEENGEIWRSLTLEESVSAISEGIEAVIDDETDTAQTATTSKSEEQHQETSKDLLTEEQDSGITATIRDCEDEKTEEIGTPQNEKLEDSFVTKTNLQKEELRDPEISGLGIEQSANVQTVDPNEPTEEQYITLDEALPLEPHENVPAITCADTLTKSDEVMELLEEVTEGVEKAAEESEDTNELIVEKEDVKECPAISIGDESVNKVLQSQIVSDDNPEAADTEVETAKVKLQIVEDFRKDPEGFPITKHPEESEDINKLIIEKEEDVEECHAIPIGDESVNKKVHSEIVSDENPEATNSEEKTEQVNQQVVEDFIEDLERSHDPEESEDINELIIEKVEDVKECPAIPTGDESVNKVLHSEILFDENPEATDSEAQTEKVNLQVVEDFSEGPERSPITKDPEDSEDINKLIAEKEEYVKECPPIPIVSESVNKVLHSEILSDENPEATDSEVHTQKVNLQLVEDFSNDPEGSPITKALEEEMLPKQSSEKKLDVPSSVSEILEEINKEAVEDANACLNTSEKVETEETCSLEAQLDDKHMKITETSPEAVALQTNFTAETSPHGEEVDGIKLEETPEAVSQIPVIACEDKDGSERINKPHIDGVKEIRGASDTVYGCKERSVEEIDETQESQIMEGPKKGTIKEEVKGPSETVTGCSYEGADVVIEDKLNVVQAATIGHSEMLHDETSTVLLFDEQDHGIGNSEDGTEKGNGTPEKEDLEDPFPTKTEEVCLLQKEPRELAISGFGVGVNEDGHNNKTDELPMEECSNLDEVSELEPQENDSEIKRTDSPVESDKIAEVARSIDNILLEELKVDESLDSRISSNRGNDGLLPHLAGEETLQEVDKDYDETSNIESEASAGGFEVHTNAIETTTIELEAGAYNDGTEASSLKIIDNLTKGALEEAEKAAESEHIKKLVIEKEAESEEPAAASIEDELTNKVQHSDMELSENLGVTDPKTQTEKVNLDFVEDLSQDREENPIEKTLEEEKPQILDSENKAEASIFVSELSEQTLTEVIEETDTCHDKLVTTYQKVETEEAQVYDKHIKIIETNSGEELQTSITTEISQQGEEFDGVELEESSASVSQLPAIVCENADKERETAEKPTRDEVEETKGASDIESDNKEQQGKAIDGTQKDDLNGSPKEGCDTIIEGSISDPQENASSTKCTGSPVESDKVMELTEEEPEGTETTVERQKEVIIEKEREIKELPVVPIDESVIKVQVLELASSENPGVTDPNTQTENLEVEDLSKEPEGSSITKALEEEMFDKQNDQKAMDVHSSASEMKGNMKEEIMEKADISCGNIENEPEMAETAESSLQEAQLDDKLLNTIETSSEDKTLQTNTASETTRHTEEVDSMKREETLELVYQLPAKECESTNKESETVERTDGDEIAETTGASDSAPGSKEQCAEELDENQNSRALEMEAEPKYQGFEAVIEEEITAGQAIKAEVPEEQLEEVSTPILSEEQEHGIHTMIVKLEDENIKKSETQQYENPEDSFGPRTSEGICLQKKEPTELDISGLEMETDEYTPKGDRNGVNGVPQHELQGNASELKCTGSPLGSDNLMEQTKSIGISQQEATKDDENLDSGIVSNNPDILTHSPGEEISQEVGEKCEEASNLKYEHYEKASEPVPDLESAAIDDAVVGLEGVHIHGSDATDTKNNKNLIEEVPQGAEKAVESENIKELIIEKESDTKDLPAVSTEDGTVKVQYAEAVSDENLTAISNMRTEIMNSEVAEILNKDPEGSAISEALQEEISQKQTSEKIVDISMSEMSEESSNETMKEVNTTCSKLEPEEVVTEETSLPEVELDDKPLKGLDTSASEKTLSTNTTTKSSLQGEKADSLNVEETSELMSQLPTVAFESKFQESETEGRPNVDAGEESEIPDTASESREQCVENLTETWESPALKNSEEDIIKVEIKGGADGVSEGTNQSFEAVIENDSAEETIEAEKPEEQLPEMSTALVSEAHGIGNITTKSEDETPQHDNPQESFGTKMTEEGCLPADSRDALETKCTDFQAESDMELTRSTDSTLQQASKDDEDLDSGISTKNVNDVLCPCSSGEEILQEEDENSEEASNVEAEEGSKIEKASEPAFQVQSAEVDGTTTKLEEGSHSHGSEPSSPENSNSPTEKNIELTELGEKLGEGSELVAEDQCKETLHETNQTQADENRSSFKSIEEQITGQELQQCDKETTKGTEGKLESRDYINVMQNEDVTTKDVISVEEAPEEAEIAEEKENIPEQMIEGDINELAAVSIEDKTVDKVQHSEPESSESFRITESDQETKEVNLEDKQDPCEKQADVSSSAFELSEQGCKGEILNEAGIYSKLGTAYEKVEAAKTILEELQLDDEPVIGNETILEETIPSIINTTETSPGDGEAEATELEKASDLVSQVPTTTYEHAQKEVIVEKPQADEVEETKRASGAVSESKDACVEEIDETQRSLTMEKLEEEIVEVEITGRSRTVSACNQGVEASFQDETTRESPKAGNSEEQLQEMSTSLLHEEEEHADKNPEKENLEDSLGTECAEEKYLQEGLRDLEISALAQKISVVVQKQTPNEVQKDEGQPQENLEIKCMGSTTGSEEVMKLTRSISSCSQEALKEENILDSGSSSNQAGDFSTAHSSGEILMQEQCKKTPILESKTIENASEFVSEGYYSEGIIKLEETEVKEQHLETSITEMTTDEIPHEKTIEANEIIKNEISNEEIEEAKQIAMEYQRQPLDKETIREREQGDQLKNGAEHEEFCEGTKKGEASENIEKQIIDEARTDQHPHLVSFRDESVKDDVPEEAKEESNDKDTETKLDILNQSDETALREQADCSDIKLVKKDLNIVDARDDKEVLIMKDEDLEPNLDVQPATSAAGVHQKGGQIMEISESFLQEPVHETSRCNEEIAPTITDDSKDIMEDKMHTPTHLELACSSHEVSEGLNVKDPVVHSDENSTSPLSETSWEEIPYKDSMISEEERQHDLTSGQQTTAASMPTKEKSSKDEGEHTIDEGPIEFSARANKEKLEESEIHNTTCDKDAEIQDQIDKLNASPLVQDSFMKISEKEVNLDLAEANESTLGIEKLEKGPDETSQKCILREAEPKERTEVTISSSKVEVQPTPQDLQPEVGSLGSVNVSWIELGSEARVLAEEKTMSNTSEPAVEPTPVGSAVSFSDLLLISVKETLQAPGCLSEEKEQMVNKEDVLAKEEEDVDVQEPEAHEDRDQEEEGDEHKKEDSGSDAPIMVEASRDINPKDGNKKSHNILSGVGSKVKHSIAKVKKAITGKSSHQKHSSPKGTATKVKEQK